MTIAPDAFEPSGPAGLYELAPCGLARTTDGGLFLVVNKTFCDWLCMTPADLLHTRRLQDLLTMGGKIFHQTHWSPLLQMQGSISEVKLEVIRKDGRSIPMVMNAVRREMDGVFVHDIAAFVAHDRDLYERELLLSRRALEETVEKATQLVEETSDKAVFAEQMMGIVSHDLRNPLSTIAMGTAALMRGEPTPSQLVMLNRISRAAERGNRLITELLDFTQARIGKGVSVSSKRVDLRQLIADALEELALAYPGHPLMHEYSGETEFELDADRVTQVIGNLVSNAVAYGRRDSQVTVRSTVRLDHCLIEVNNFGNPIPVEVQGLLFKPMVRGANESSSSMRSLGLGLYIVDEIAKAHGGSVSVESSLAHGTSFFVRLPAPNNKIEKAGDFVGVTNIF